MKDAFSVPFILSYLNLTDDFPCLNKDLHTYIYIQNRHAGEQNWLRILPFKIMYVWL